MFLQFTEEYQDALHCSHISTLPLQRFSYYNSQTEILGQRSNAVKSVHVIPKYDKFDSLGRKSHKSALQLLQRKKPAMPDNIRTTHRAT